MIFLLPDVVFVKYYYRDNTKRDLDGGDKKI
jgi:hypothetical protein